jgi:hypothetical protein
MTRENSGEWFDLMAILPTKVNSTGIVGLIYSKINNRNTESFTRVILCMALSTMQ